MEEEKQQYSYDAVIPSWLLISKEVPERAKLLYARIRALSRKEGYCWAANKFLSEETGVSERTIIRFIHLLEKMELIKTEKKPRKGGGWERIIWLGKTCGKVVREGDKMSPQGDTIRGALSYQGDTPSNKQCQQVGDISKDINNDVIIKNKKRYDELKTILKNKLSVSYNDRTEVDEEVAMLQRAGLLKRPNKEEIRALKLEQENWKNANL